MRVRFARNGASSSITSTFAMSAARPDGHVEARSASRCAFKPDRAAVEVERFPHDGEPETGARDVADIAGAVKGFEQPRMVFLRDADAAVGDFEGRLSLGQAHPEFDGAALRRILDGIGD